MTEKDEREYEDMLTDYYSYQLDEEEKKKNTTAEDLEDVDDIQLELQDKDGNFLLSGILNLCAEFYYNNDKESYNKIQEIKKQLQIKPYLSLADKGKLVVPILAQAKIVDENEVIMAIHIEVGKVIIGLLDGYCVNLINDLDLTSLQLNIVDLLYQTDLIDYILKFCEKDYNRLCDLVDRSLNFSHIFNILNAFDLLDPKNMDEFNKNIEAINTKITPENVEFLKALLKKGNKDFDHMLDDITTATVDNVLHGDKKEKNEEK